MITDPMNLTDNAGEGSYKYICARFAMKRVFYISNKYLEEQKMNANVAIQVLPGVQGDEEVVRIVDEVIDYIKSTGVTYYVGPCETAMEGDYDELMEIVKQCQYIAVKAGAPSVMSYVKITYKPDGEKLTIERKTAKHHIND